MSVPAMRRDLVTQAPVGIFAAALASRAWCSCCFCNMDKVCALDRKACTNCFGRPGQSVWDALPTGKAVAKVKVADEAQAITAL
jgi:hypothetical protein